MKLNALKQFVSLRKTLESQKAQLETSLAAINEALGISSFDIPSPTSTPVTSPTAVKDLRPAKGKKKPMSEETKAKLRVSSLVRWAKVRGNQSATPSSGSDPKSKKSAGGKPAQKKPITLREALLQITASKPLARNELIDAAKKVGYTTTSSDPTNMLNRFLYGKTAILKSVDGKFSPK